MIVWWKASSVLVKMLSSLKVVGTNLNFLGEKPFKKGYKIGRITAELAVHP